MVAKKEAAIRAALAEPANTKRQQRRTQQMTLKLGGPKEMDAFLQREIKFWGPGRAREQHPADVIGRPLFHAFGGPP